MELLCKWNQLSLVKRILIGLILGAVLGFLPARRLLPQPPWAPLFVGALKALAPPACLFFLVLHSWHSTRKGPRAT